LEAREPVNDNNGQARDVLVWMHQLAEENGVVTMSLWADGTAYVVTGDMAGDGNSIAQALERLEGLPTVEKLR
jgi:hypothetical protein